MIWLIVFRIFRVTQARFSSPNWTGDIVDAMITGFNKSNKAAVATPKYKSFYGCWIYPQKTPKGAENADIRESLEDGVR